MKALPKIYFKSLGCKVNLSDLAALLDQLPAASCEIVSQQSQADYVILNTCTVTHKADRDVRKIIGGLKRDFPDLPVIVTGCAAVNCREELETHQNVRAVIPPGNHDAIVQALGIKIEHASQESSFSRIGRRRAMLKIQDGCNSHCAYCVLPSVRGPEHSLELNQVLAKVETYLKFGHREIVLCGIHLGRYGAGLAETVSLSSLLDSLAPIFADLGRGCRLRLSSIEPLELTDQLIEVIARSAFVCTHFHIPVQSGDNGILAGMKRPYKIEQFESLILRLYSQFPDVALGTDILVGFPGETASSADKTLAMVKNLPLSYLHVFTFSPRAKTLAEKMAGQVDPGTIKQRAKEVRRVSDLHWQEFLRAGIGQHHEVLIEKKINGGFRGLSSTFRRIQIQSDLLMPGDMVEVVAKNLDADALVGVLCNTDS
ncbi:MAG: MiaB/RimO family radical SAM methylthiotransferase [Deltaproteobacteria bacterium]|nr:MiaB/RimO family radical SAM methylthiotransferase [Deltaproteobacteria bacterium]